jgi:hypothetical protein
LFIMVEAHSHLAFAPRGAGLLYGMLWFARGASILGWYIGTRDGVHEAAFFVLPDYYSAKPEVLYRSAGDDLYGPWVEVDSHGQREWPHPPPIAEELRPELARLQDQFVRHWLFFDDDPEAEGQARALAAQGHVLRHVNVRADRLGRFATGAAVWHFDAPGADRNVLLHLSRRWPLDERPGD